MLGQMLGAGMGAFQKVRNWRDEQDERTTQREREREMDQKLQTAMGGVQGAVNPGVAQVIAPPNAAPPASPPDAAPTAGPQSPAQQSAPQQEWGVESSAQRFLAAQAVALAQGPEVYERVKPVLEASRQHLLTVHAGQWMGDPRKPQDAIAFASHMAHGAAVLGMPNSVEEVKKVSEWAETIRKENYGEALQMLQMGDVPRAVEAFNRSGDENITMDDIQIKPVTIRMGNQAVPTFEATVKRDGQSQTFNVYDSLFNSLAITEQAEMLRKNEESRALVNQRDASASASNALASQRRMPAGQAQGVQGAQEAPAVRGLSSDQERDLNALKSRAERLQSQLLEFEDPESPRARQLRQELERINSMEAEILGTTVRAGDVRAGNSETAPAPAATRSGAVERAAPSSPEGLLDEVEAAPARWDRSAGSATPRRIPGREGGGTRAERAIREHSSLLVRQQAMGLVDEAQEALQQRPQAKAEIEAMLARELHSLGIRW